jgi:hypothetical protein
MARRERQIRYKTTGGAADLVKVEVLVPPENRGEILALARTCRDEHRRKHGQRIDAEDVVRRVADACEDQPRRYTQRSDIDKVVVTSVNVPFPVKIDASALAAALKGGAVPRQYAGHIARLLEEVPVGDILRFCDRHGISATEIARVMRKQTGLRRPELQEHLDALVPHS